MKRRASDALEVMPTAPIRRIAPNQAAAAPACARLTLTRFSDALGEWVGLKLDVKRSGCK